MEVQSFGLEKLLVFEVGDNVRTVRSIVCDFHPASRGEIKQTVENSVGLSNDHSSSSRRAIHAWSQSPRDLEIKLGCPRPDECDRSMDLLMAAIHQGWRAGSVLVRVRDGQRAEIQG
ncbi:hypothetical protein PoB_003739400 [Plakobranchus ocellatus]|uniref:Uncharacterized protein n=1 Tax=Plakobranchus ocellatus TaxID=259542 RepID=A0AAV4AXM1_9GAST|nr:hypothetical protein PoB_003739400 [Plakobranchus ocellatus]